MRLLDYKAIAAVLIILCVVAAFSSAEAQRRHDQFREEQVGTPRFASDYAVFWNPDTRQINIEIYSRIPMRALYAVLEDGQEISEYELAIIVRGEDGRQVTGTSWNERLENPSADKYTHQSPSFILERKVFDIERGKYTIETTLTDMVSNLKSQNVIAINLDDYEEPMMLSSIEFSLGGQDRNDIIESDFNRRGKVIIPSVSRSFDSQRHKPGYYCELYLRKNTPDIVQVIERIESRENKWKSDPDTLEVVIQSREDKVVQLTDSLELDKLPPGGYKLVLEIWDVDFKNKLAKREASFAIDWSLKTLVENDYKSAIEQLRYIATPEERDSLRKVNEKYRLAAIRKFWKKHDPTPATPENELRDEYYGRVRYANVNFSGFGRPGYLTDFGRVYITYGKPDQIERHPFEQNTKPYEIWYYYKYHRKFVFVDDTGYGNYELLYPFADGIKM
ncbi:MAG: GWxTD domain-containing protein [candidate division Zixibacteria bacterium]|nr:GWxTD domain-containing protein [candidate division Zixibacteria bacterium]